MANRAYLYSTDESPYAGGKVSVRGLSEWFSEVPLLYKLLLSVNTEIVPSAIWTEHEGIALTGDYNLGVRCFKEFLEYIREPNFLNLGFQALEFLTLPENRRKFFLLEAGEIFCLDEAHELTELNRGLREEIADVQALAEQWREVFGRASQKVQQSMIDSFGLGMWSNSLYFDPNSVRGRRESPGVTFLTVTPQVIIEELTATLDPILRDVWSSDALLFAEWPTLSVSCAPDSPVRREVDGEPRSVWNAVGSFAEGDEEPFTMELLVELSNPEQPLLNLSWIVFPHDEVTGLTPKTTLKLLRYLNGANRDLCVKFRFHDDPDEKYISCEICLPAYAAESDLIAWAVSESLGLAMESFDDIEKILTED